MTLGAAMIGLVLFLVALALTIPTLVFAIECLLSTLPEREPLAAPSSGSERRYVVVVPAHDEARGITRTLDALVRELDAHGRILVVADNCTDETARVARSCGVEVIERVDAERRGKGYALAFAADYLEAGAPDVLVFVDADCLVGPGSIRALIDACAATDRPVQADYTLVGTGASPIAAISNFAFRVRNRIRPRGLAQLGGPSGLFGTGMAMPYALFRSLPSAEGHLVEDMWLGVECALRGRAARFVPNARVTSESAKADAATETQRTRWERGHLGVVMRHVPRLLRSGDREAMLLGLDLAVPPVTLLLLALIAFVVVSGWVGGRIGAGLPFEMAGAALATFIVSVGLVWVREGRDVLPPRVLLEVPRYVMWKLSMYVGFAKKPEPTWVRTDRGEDVP